jgi:hypothetical protein
VHYIILNHQQNLQKLSQGLRRVVFGSASVPTRSEWLTTGLVFRDPDVEFAYGLRVPSSARPSTRALLMSIQAHLVRYLLFERSMLNLMPVTPSTRAESMDENETT